jgi:hypothetical protein
VLLPGLEGSYKGKCKNGLANGTGLSIGKDRYDGQFINGLPDGKGTYTWAGGASYKGEWKEGKRSGEGVYIFFINGKDSTLNGNWLNDNYLGPKAKEPDIRYKTGIDRYTFKKEINVKNRVLIDIFQNGMYNMGISDFMISSTSGYETRVGNSIGYDEVIFPVIIKVSYTSWNKLNTATYYVEFEFEIFEAGDWRVALHN